MNDNKWMYIMAYLENIALIILAGFLCWFFKSGWGALVLIFSNTVKNKVNSTDEDKNNDEI